MDAFYQNAITINQKGASSGIKANSYFTHQNPMNMNFRPHQMSTTEMPRRNSPITAEFSEPFDLNSDYRLIQKATPSVVQHDRRHQPYTRPNKSDMIPRQPLGWKPQTMSQFYLPTFEPKNSYEMPVCIKEDYFHSTSATDFNSSVLHTNNTNKIENSFVANKKEKPKKTLPKQFKFTKISSLKRQCYFIGSIDQIIRWFRLAKQANISAIYETVAILESIQKGKSPDKYVLFLRKESGFNPVVLQAVFFSIDRNIPQLKTGQLVTCVGRMIGANKLHVLDIWNNTLEEQAGIKRVSFLCQRTLQEATISSSDSQ